MPETKKKLRKPRARRAPAAKKSKKGLKQKQKQKQEVTVNVSAGGSGGGGFMPQAPQIDYGLIQQLIRPANTVNVPIRAAAPIAEMPVVRPAEPPNLARELPYSSRLIPVSGELPSSSRLISSEPPHLAEAIRGPFAEPHVAEIAKRTVKPAVLPPPPKIEPVGLRMSPGYDTGSETESNVSFRSPRPIAHHKRTGTIPSVGGIGSGKKTLFEEDIFGRSMPKIGGGAYNPEKEKSTRSVVKKKGIVSYLDLPSSGETETEAAARVGMRFM